MDRLTPEESLKKARGYALRLFKFRPRSEAELTAKLRDRGFEADIVSALIGEFKSRGYIDDALFTRAWLESRLKKHGFQRVSGELAQKGISKENIASVWAEIRGDHDEAAVAVDLLRRRARLYQGMPLFKRTQRMMDFLARRGFTAETIDNVIREL